MLQSICEKMKKIPTHVWILVALMFLGLFLRSYGLHDWLHFGKDQARDAIITQSVARGESSWPLLGAAMGNTSFKIGPIYYYFQIISAKIFGQDPAVLAFPDILFSVLSIPLLFLFLRRYFNEKISLSLASIYSVSFFSVEYARFAWNPNPIPFFVILFMLSMYELLIAGEKTAWKWIVGIGVAIGVGVQLHAILMILLPVMFCFVAVFLLFKGRKVWLKLLIVFVIAVGVNFPYLINEFESNFSNTKTFIKSSSDKSPADEGELPRNFELNVLCHAQANMHMLSSLGHPYDCNFLSLLFPKEFKPTYVFSFILILVSMAFSLFGYLKLASKVKNGVTIEQKYYFGLIALYALLYFPLLMPAIDGASHRYFNGLIFVPFVFLGLLLELLAERMPKFTFKMFLLIVLFFAALNAFTITKEAIKLQNKERGEDGFVVLGELELMRDYIINESAGQKTVYLIGGVKFLPIYAVPMQYLLSKSDIEMIRGRDDYDFLNYPIFYIWKNVDQENVPESLAGKKVIKFRNFGNLSISKLEN